MSQVEGAVPQFLWAHPRAAGGVEKFSQKPSLSRRCSARPPEPPAPAGSSRQRDGTTWLNMGQKS